MTHFLTDATYTMERLIVRKIRYIIAAIHRFCRKWEEGVLQNCPISSPCLPSDFRSSVWQILITGCWIVQHWMVHVIYCVLYSNKPIAITACEMSRNKLSTPHGLDFYIGIKAPGLWPLGMRPQSLFDSLRLIIGSHGKHGNCIKVRKQR